MNPESLKYSETHQWVLVEGDIATVGITEHAVEELGDLVYLDLPEKGKELKKGEVFGEIESVKTVSELYTPLDGTVVEVNEHLPDNLEELNADPYGLGWMIKLKIADKSQLDSLMSAAEYEEQVKKEKEEKAE